MLYAIFTWIQEQLSARALFRTLVILALINFFPLTWQLTVSFLLLYGLSKYRAIATAVREFHFVPFLINELTEGFLYQPVTLFRALLAALIFSFSHTPIFAFLSIYSIYRAPSSQWLRTAAGVINFMGFNLRMLALLATTLFMGYCLQTGSFVLLLGWTVEAFSWVAFLTGIRRFFSDVGHGIRHILRLGTSHSGKIVGAQVGRTLIQRFGVGEVTGNLGAALGHVQNPGPLSEWVNLFSPRGNFFFSGILKGFSGNLAGILGGLFSYQVHTIGNFSGTISPSSTALLGWTLLGILGGYLFERMLDKLYDNLAHDVNYAHQAATPWVNARRQNIQQFVYGIRLQVQAVAQRIYQIRWYLLFTTVATPVILTSASGAPFIAWAGGRMAVAAGLIATAILATLAALQGFASVLRMIGERIRRRREHPQPPPAPIPAPVPAPEIAPAPGDPAPISALASVLEQNVPLAPGNEAAVIPPESQQPEVLAPSPRPLTPLYQQQISGASSSAASPSEGVLPAQPPDTSTESSDRPAGP